MNISVELENEPDSYRPLDIVQGFIHVDVLKPTRVSRIALSFEGATTAKVKFDRPGFPQIENIEATQKSYSHRFSYISAALFPPYNLPKKPNGYGLTLGRHSFEFSFVVPMLGDCNDVHKGLPQSETTLPSTLRIRSSHLDLEVIYTLRAYFYCPGRLTPKEMTIEKALNVTFVDPPRIEASSPDDMFRRVGRLPSESPLVSTSSISKLGVPAEFPPRYAASIFLDVTIYNGVDVRPGDCVPLTLRLLLPRNLLEELGPMILSSLKIALISNTMASICRQHIVSQTRFPLTDIQPGVILSLDATSHCTLLSFTLDNSWCSSCTIPDVPPSSKCCCFSHEYSIQVEAGLSPQGKPGADVELVSAEVPVKISNMDIEDRSIREASTQEPPTLSRVDHDTSWRPHNVVSSRCAQATFLHKGASPPPYTL